MQNEGLLERFKVNLGKGVGGGDALHKPILLLLFLKASGSAHSQRLVPFSDVDRVMGPILQRFGESRAVEYPFVRLGNDKPRIWEVPGIEGAMPRKGQTDAKRSELVRLNLKGGFTEGVWQGLRGDPTLREQAIEAVLSQVSEELRVNLLTAVLAADEL